MIVLAYIAGLSVSAINYFWTNAATAAVAAVAAAVLLSPLIACRYCDAPSLSGVSRLAIIAAAFLLIGLMVGSLRLHLLAESQLEPLTGKWISAEVQIKKAPTLKDDGVSFIARANRGSRRQREIELSEDVLVRISCGRDCGRLGQMSLKEGSRLSLQGTVEPIESHPGRDFDYGLYLKRKGINVAISADISRVEPLVEGRGGFSGLIDTLREHARSSMSNCGWGSVSSDAIGLFQGMVIGDTRGISDAVISDFRDSGLLHLLAVSGQNVVLLGFVVEAFCRGISLPRRTAIVAAATVIVVYVPLTGADASILRAGAVGLLGLAAELLSRQADKYHFLALAAAAILTVNPNGLFDPGFQLSFAAVLAIFQVAPLFMSRLGFLPALLREPVAISAAAGIVTAPITLIHFNQISLVTVPANVAAAPVSGPVMLLGVVTILVEPLSGTLNWLINGIASILTGYLVVNSRLFAAIPGSVYIGESPGILGVSAFYAMIALAILISRRPGCTGQLIRLIRRHAMIGGGIVALAAAALYVTANSGSVSPPSAFTVSFLDVGQGDATLLQDPAGATILIDGGPGSEILPALEKSGVSNLDAVILTHPHADHFAGLDDVLARYDVAAFYDSGAAMPEPEGSGTMDGGRDYDRLGEQLAEKNIERQTLRRGQKLSFGGLELSVYHPGDWLRPDDANANSIVIVASYEGLDILLPGDAEGEVLNTLDLPHVDVYKAPHHGSTDLYLEPLLSDIDPDCSVISVGKDNDYGHPSGSTIGSLGRAGATIFRTDNQGTVRITTAGGCEGAITER